MDKYCTFYGQYLSNVIQEDKDFCLIQFWSTSCDNCPFCKEAHHE